MQQFPPFTHVHPIIISSRHASHVSPLQSVSVANRSAGHPTARRQDPPAPATAALPPSRGARPPTFVPRSTGSTLIPAAPHTSSPGPACARSGADPVLLQARLGDPGIAGEEKGTTREIRETRRPDRGGVRAAHTARRPTRQRWCAGALVRGSPPPAGSRPDHGGVRAVYTARRPTPKPHTAALRMRGCADRPGRQCPGRSRPVPGVRAGQASRPHHAREGVARVTMRGGATCGHGGAGPQNATRAAMTRRARHSSSSNPTRPLAPTRCDQAANADPRRYDQTSAAPSNSSPPRPQPLARAAMIGGGAHIRPACEPAVAITTIGAHGVVTCDLGVAAHGGWRTRTARLCAPAAASQVLP
jgi:hypothetical protein